jgi:ribosome-binding protein aMBF1 (putative translation factor)
MSAHIKTPLINLTVTYPGRPARVYQLPARMTELVVRAVEQKGYKPSSKISTADFEEGVLEKLSRAACTLSTRRWQRQLTQKALAAASGVHASHLSAMERGKRKVGEAVARRLAAVLGCDWRELISEDF